MKLIITSPVPVVPPNSYTVEITTYRGDSDGDSHLIMGPFKRDEEEASLQCLLETLQRTKEQFPNGRLGNEEYSYTRTVLGFLQWFGASTCSTLEEMQENYPEELEIFGIDSSLAITSLVKEFYADNWPFQEGCIEETLSKYEVFYYDEGSVKHNVEIDWA